MDPPASQSASDQTDLSLVCQVSEETVPPWAPEVWVGACCRSPGALKQVPCGHMPLQLMPVFETDAPVLRILAMALGELGSRTSRIYCGLETDSRGCLASLAVLLVSLGSACLQGLGA